MSKLVDSGIEWIGMIPEEWKLERLQWHLSEVKESNNPLKTNKVLSLTNKSGVIPYEEKGAQGNVAKEDYTQYKIAYPGTIVANSMNILIGSVGICNYYGCVSPVYYVFRPNECENLDFLNYIFQTTGFQKELRKYANGILEIRLRLSSNNILKRYAAFPSIEVQNKIVAAIKEKETKINALIANEEKQIEKLKEYKQSLITEVVTKGLDPSVHMKDSGVEWIGMIPEGWKVKRLKFIADDIFKGNGITKEDIVCNGNISCVRYGEIYTKYNKTFEICSTKTNLDKVAVPSYFEYGDILSAITGELVDEIGKSVVYLGKEKCLAGGDIVVVKHSQDPIFMGFVMDSSYIQKQKSYGKSKLKVVHCSADDIKNLLIAFPAVEEQIKIGEYCFNLNKKIETIISNKKEKIEKYKLYRQSIIYEYITGKKEI